MKHDYEYICTLLSRLTRLQVRIYKNNDLFYNNTPCEFTPDIASPFLNEFIKRSKSADYGYYIFNEILFWGYISLEEKDSILIIGPTTQFDLQNADLYTILNQLHEKQNRLTELSAYFMKTSKYPFENFLNILASVIYFIKQEKVTSKDLISDDEELKALTSEVNELQKEQYNSSVKNYTPPHSSYAFENEMLSYITDGNPSGLQKFLSQANMNVVGQTSHNALRQNKNMFICAATTASRAAIKGGFPEDSSYRLSDIYIQKVEAMTNIESITRLSAQMLLDYAEQVKRHKLGGSNSSFLNAINNFISINISRKITIEMIAAELKMNKTYLCEKFKFYTKKTLSQYILDKKIEEAKRLISFTDLSLIQISNFLDFSSQSHFINIFKERVGITPKAYREQNHNNKS